MSTSLTAPRVPLYSRLPEIYRQRDIEQIPPGQLEAYLSIVENVLGALHSNIGELYRDLFIESCDPWVIPYIGDLLGVTPLSGPAWTLRADVADAIALRRRKGTLYALELLAYDLTEWSSYCVELRDTLAWHQHLNHLRPELHKIALIRDPAILSLMGTPFDTFAYTADFKPADRGVLRRNLPDVAVFLWRLIAYQAGASMPVWRATSAIGAPPPGGAARGVRFDIDPLGNPVRLFNLAQLTPSADLPMVSAINQVPNPLLAARMTSAYVSVNTYDAAANPPAVIDETGLALQFHLPETLFAGDVWTFRGANLCGWETPLRPPLGNREIAVDPVIGRAVLGVMTDAEAGAIESSLLMNFTYAAPGPVGAHPIAPMITPAAWLGAGVPFEKRTVRFREDPLALQHALDDLESATQAVWLEIDDSMTHTLDLSVVAGANSSDPILSLALKFPLMISASAENRPVVKLIHHPLAFRPVPGMADAQVASLKVLLEGMFVNGDGLAAGDPLIARAALPLLEIVNCSFDPGGVRQRNGTRSGITTSMSLDARFGFSSDAEFDAFKPTPKITFCRSITGPLEMESVYQLQIQDSIVDGGAGPGEDGSTAMAIGSSADPVNGWGAVLCVKGVTVLGRTRVRSATGAGGIFCHALEAQNNQVGCLRFCWFAAETNRLPQNFACVTGVTLEFVDDTFGAPGYAQLAADCDESVRQKGPASDEMGAYGFELNAHKWRNLQIRFREFMPAGIKPVIVPVT